MAGLWEYEDAPPGTEPVTFSELAQLIRDGELRPAGRVRRAGTGHWQAADSVIGLVRAAQSPSMEPAEGGAASRSASAAIGALHRAADPAVHSGSPGPQPSGRGRVLVQLSIFLGLIGLSVLIVWRTLTGGPPRFPESHGVTFELKSPRKLDQMRPPAALLPTLPALDSNEPRLVPGLEQLTFAKAPTLTPDLRTIAFEGPGQALLIARRDDREATFSPPVLIPLTLPGGPTFPSLSPDGLELLLTIYGKPSTLWIASRANREEAFSNARPLGLESGVDPSWSLEAAQFLGPNLIRFTAGDTEFRQRLQLYAHRAGPGAAFQKSGEMPIANPWHRFFVTAEGRRAFFPDADGLYLTALHATARQFLLPERVLDGELLGPGMNAYDDTVWIAPQEDVLFYCSPGPGAPPDRPRRLWMVRF